jgi:hypothetical protein
MNSPKLLHLLLCLMVVTLVFSVAVKYLFKDDAKWQQVSAQGLANQMQQGIEQMYWQWQQSGRPASIEYQPEHADHAMMIQMSSTGKPIIGHDEGACKRFLTWFVEDVAIDTFVQTTTIPREEAAEDDRGRGCEFTVAKQVIFYQADSAHILY